MEQSEGWFESKVGRVFHMEHFGGIGEIFTGGQMFHVKHLATWGYIC